MKAVGESMEVPLLYYKNNVVGTINLLEVNGLFPSQQHNLTLKQSCVSFKPVLKISTWDDYS